MWPLGVVDDEVVIQVRLHLFQGLVPLGTPLDAEVLIQQCAVQPLDEPIALWPPNLGGAMLDLLELKEQFIRMFVLTSAEFPAIVAEHRADLGIVSLEEGQHIVVEHMDCRDRQLVCIQAAPGIAAEAIDDRLQVDLADALERADEEGIDGHQLTGGPRYGARGTPD